MPSSPLHSAKHVSMGQHIPLTRIKVASFVSRGALLKLNFHSGSEASPLTLHRITTQISWPGRRSSGSTRKSATSGLGKSAITSPNVGIALHLQEEPFTAIHFSFTCLFSS